VQLTLANLQPRFSSREVMVQLGIALAFYVLAQLSLSLGVSAFLTRPLWLPAALLAACVISRGTRDITGLAIGAAAFGYFLYRTRQHAFPVACINMLAVFAQVLVADWAMRRFMSPRARELWQARDLILSSVIFGPIMMALKPAVIFPMLIWLNLIPTDNVLDRAMDWMASDILAAYLAGPILLVLLGQPREWWLSRRSALLYGQFLIVVGFVSAMQTTAKIEGDRVQDRVRAELSARAERLQGQLQQLGETTQSYSVPDKLSLPWNTKLGHRRSKS
jgi:diguanylate cyclase